MRDEKPVEPRPESGELKQGEDYYYEGPYLVFTERYHLKRGYCCNSGCRHCPYRTRQQLSGPLSRAGDESLPAKRS